MGRLRPRQAWGLGVVVAGAALVALVAVAADGAPLQAPTDDGRATLPDRLMAGLEMAVLVAAVLMVVALIVLALTGERNRRARPSGRRALFRTIFVMAALAFLAAWLLPHDRNDKRPEQPAQAAAPAANAGAQGDGSRPTWPLALLGGAVVVALGAAAWAARRRRPTFDGELDAGSADEARRAAAGSAFSASLADLEADPDPRRAIVAAYARLLDGLDAAGFGRRPSEAPEEHLRRVLEQLRVPDAPLRTLVALFGEARFSEHPLTAVHKQSAIDAFRSARDALSELTTAGTHRP